MWTKTFWLQTAERAVKSFGQSAILAMGAGGGFSLFQINWRNCLGFALGGMVLSILTSLASLQIGQANSPSLVRTD